MILDLKVKWYKNKSRTEIQESAHFHMKIVDELTFTLTIVGAEMDDAGFYLVEVITIRFVLYHKIRCKL
jgi:hypothetical protein